MCVCVRVGTFFFSRNFVYNILNYLVGYFYQKIKLILKF